MDMLARPCPKASRDRGTQGCIRLNHGCVGYGSSVVADKYEHLSRNRINDRTIRYDMSASADCDGLADAWSCASPRNTEGFPYIAQGSVRIRNKNIARNG